MMTSRLYTHQLARNPLGRFEEDVCGVTVNVSKTLAERVSA